MKLRAYLTSYLLRKYLVKRNQALDLMPNAWLVWEAGSWTAPTSSPETVAGKSQTNVDPRTSGDALCYGLPEEGGEATSILIGRDLKCDLVINDATVSREHLIVRYPGGATHGTWVAMAAPNSRAPVVRGTHLGPKMSLALSDGDRIGLGDIQMTFYGKAGLLARLEAEMRKQLGASAPTG